jgi:hypothetical protein
MATSQSAPDRDIDTDPVDRVQRVGDVLKTVCCEASVVMTGTASVCADCGDTITDDLGETLDLLNVR